MMVKIGSIEAEIFARWPKNLFLKIFKYVFYNPPQVLWLRHYNSGRYESLANLVLHGNHLVFFPINFFLFFSSIKKKLFLSRFHKILAKSDFSGFWPPKNMPSIFFMHIKIFWGRQKIVFLWLKKKALFWMANQKWQKKFEFKIFKNAEISGILEKMFFLVDFILYFFGAD